MGLKSTTDYGRILKLYMATVLHAEGTTFVSRVPADKLTAGEHAVLMNIENEVRRENPGDW